MAIRFQAYARTKGIDMGKVINQEGNRLRVALKQAQQANNDSISSMAAKLGASQSYLSQLLSGDRPMSGVSDGILRKIAEYLGVPLVIALMQAERLTSADFMVSPSNLPDRLNAGMKAIGRSSEAIESGVGVEELMILPERVKLLLVLLYQQAYQVEMLNTTPPAWWLGWSQRQ